MGSNFDISIRYWGYSVRRGRGRTRIERQQVTSPLNCFFLKYPNYSIRCRDSVANSRQANPDSGLGFQVKVLKILRVFFLFPWKRQRTHAARSSLSASLSLSLTLSVPLSRTLTHSLSLSHSFSFSLSLSLSLPPSPIHLSPRDQ